MSKQSPKRQRVANDQLEVLDELSVDELEIFMREYSQYIPYKKLWQVIGRNKQLISQFNEYATDFWWRKRVKNDFYDYYDAIVVSETKTIREDIQEWMRVAIKTVESAWKKPWKLVYMSCYGIITLIDASSSPFKNQGIFSFDELVLRNEFPNDYTRIVSSDFMIRRSGIACTITSWVSNMPEKLIEMNAILNTTLMRGVKNGIIIYEEDGTIIYDRKTNTVKQAPRWSFNDHADSSEFSSLIYDKRRKILVSIKDLSKSFPVESNVYSLCQDYYMISNLVYQYPQTLVERLELARGEGTQQIFGPFNFDTQRFVIGHSIYNLSELRMEDRYEIRMEDRYEIDLNGRKLRFEGKDLRRFCYGMYFHQVRKTTVIVPSGRTIVFKFDIMSIFHGICGPFMLYNLAHKWYVFDLWSTLQQAMKEPFGPVSGEHCHNCGFLAQIDCKDCGHSFCGKQCAKEHFQNPVRPIACNHGVE